MRSLFLLPLLAIHCIACESAAPPALPDVAAAAAPAPRDATASEPPEVRGPGESAGFAPHAASGDYEGRF